VIVPSNTFIATALAASYTGAKVVFVEPDIRTFDIDPSLIEQAITPRTKAIMPCISMVSRVTWIRSWISQRSIIFM
jgi:dTDP-4-amino-4,6-dideoxygalactose transaminase